MHLPAPLTKKLNEFSGGQQARLLLAQALIQDPDLLLLDEPTNNLDKQGIAHLTQFLIDYKKTVIVISHDADFLNSFTQGVLYLDMFTQKIEQYAGDYLERGCGDQGAVGAGTHEERAAREGYPTSQRPGEFLRTERRPHARRCPKNERKDRGA